MNKSFNCSVLGGGKLASHARKRGSIPLGATNLLSPKKQPFNDLSPSQDLSFLIIPLN